MEINQEQLRAIVQFQPHEDVAGMQVIMQDASLMDLSNKGAQLPGQALPDANAPIRLQSSQRLFDERAQRLGMIQTPSQEKAIARPRASRPLGHTEGGDGRNPSCGNRQSALKFHHGFRGSNQLPNPRSHVSNPVMLEIEAQTGKIDTIDLAVRTMLDQNRLAGGQPLLQPQPLWPKQMLATFGCHPPAQAARLEFKELR